MLPRNEYGSFDIFSGELPKGVMHLKLKYLPSICKKNNI